MYRFAAMIPNVQNGTKMCAKSRNLRVMMNNEIDFKIPSGKPNINISIRCDDSECAKWHENVCKITQSVRHDELGYRFQNSIR